MKKLILTIVAALAAFNVFANGEFGICAGYNNMLEVTRITEESKTTESVDLYHGFYAGVEYAFTDVIGDNWKITPGIQLVGDFGQKNQKVNIFDRGDVWGQEKDFYFQIPVLVSYAWDLDGWSPYLGLDAKFLVGIISPVGSRPEETRNGSPQNPRP